MYEGIVEWNETHDGKWKAYDEKDNQLTGWVKEENTGKWYYCCSDDVQTGWFKDGKAWYYLSPCKQVVEGKQLYKGEMVTGWIELEDGWYYLSEGSYPAEAIYQGMMLANTTKNIGGKDYKFDAAGKWINEANKLSEEGAKFIGSWEGFYDHAYYDPCWGRQVKKYWTIGYGTTYQAKPEAFPCGLNSKCTQEQALEWLKEEANNKCAIKIEQYAACSNVKLNQNEFDALIDFCYNAGTSALFGSSLWRNIVNGNRDEATIIECFEMWSYANEKYYKGLNRRRKAEARLFLYGDYTGNR